MQADNAILYSGRFELARLLLASWSWSYLCEGADAIVSTTDDVIASRRLNHYRRQLRYPMPSVRT